MTDYSFVSDNNIKENVKLFKEAAIFLFDLDENVGTLGANWRPPEGKKALGYFSEDGIEVGKESGDTTEIKGHNGDTVLSDTNGAYFTIKTTALEVKKDTVELYFSTKVKDDGTVEVDANASAPHKKLILAGLDQHGKLIVCYCPEVQVSETESFNWKNSELFDLGVTLRTYRSNRHLDKKLDLVFYGLVDGKAVAPASSSETAPAGSSESH